jgi:DNA-binding NarL/FixJ family response regulator
MIKVLIADDHQLFRDGLKSLFKNDREVKIIDEAKNGKELIDKYFQHKPDIMLIDIAMPEVSGTEAVERILAEDPEAKPLFLSMHLGEEYIYHVLKSGGLGLISKNAMKEEVVDGIKSVLDGKKQFFDKSEDELQSIINKYDFLKSKDEEVETGFLTKKEIEILRLIADGMTSKEIANRLEISKRTVDTHRAHIMDKAGLKNFSEVMRFAITYFEEKNE